MTISGIADNAAADLLLLVLFTLAAPITDWLLRKVRRFRLGVSARTALIQLALIFIFSVLEYFKYRVHWGVASLALLLVPLFTLRNFRWLGISDVFRDARGGVDFSASLSAATKSLKFLGIGADKLTKLPEFSAAMKRCATEGRTARFLLSAPDNPALERMARRNGTDPEAYKDRVRESLRRIGLLRLNQGLNIEVRLYRNEEDADYQWFRLFFVNDQFCILGWTVWGNHEGYSNPQVILENTFKEGESTTSMYKAFDDYYERLWGGAEPVDLQAVL